MTQQIQKKAGMYKQIETDIYYGFGKLVDLTVFQSSFFWFVTIYMICWGQERCDFAIQRRFLKFHSVTVINLGPGSAVGEKGKKQGQKEKI